MTDLMITVPNGLPFAWNLLLAWVWIVAGFVSGAGLGMGFQREDFLGGYASFKRRLYRLGHIAFFGTGILNLLFFFTISLLGMSGARVTAAGWAFLLGAVAMPLACAVCASLPKLKPVFAVPVVALATGGVLTCMEVWLR